ncbi:TonB-dependent receptor [Sphingobium sp. EM0848]|uniref:TonB-dependent receptor n=1 Tax=Sphingobium sp. EM0848 TaxID=2743473 RepID=UPI00159C5E58|nr:TonB-dependent receptor [Sphingobium sp. EM0848]
MRRFKPVHALAMTTCWASVAPAFAQDQAPQANVGVADIIVTANRRAQNQQDVPIAVSAVTSEMAAKLGVTDIATLTNVVPGFTFNRQSSGAQPFIRGVGNQSATIGNEPSVAMFVDDVYIPTSNAAIFEFNNIDSVEVLKGPQGTLFGRNATGGVVHVHTREPSTSKASTDFELGYSNYDTVTAKAYVNLPVTDSVAVNVAAYRVNQGEGWGHDIYTGDDIFTRQAWGVRGKLLFNIGEKTELLLSGGYNYQKGTAGMSFRTVEGFAGRAGITPEQAGAGFYDGMTGIGDYYKAKFAMGSAKLTHELGDVRFVSITAYTDTKNPNHYDISAFRGNLTADYRQEEWAFTQEVQLMSSESSKLQWIVGGFYLKDAALFDGIFTGQGPAAGTAQGGRNLGPAVPAGRYSSSHARQRTESLSAFGQASMEILPALTATLGLRYTSDKRSIEDNGGEFGIIGGAVLASSGPFPDSRRFNKLTGRFSLDYKINDDLMVYAAFNRGFKSGVYSTSSYNSSTRAVVAAVLPETLDAYSGGFKSEWFDRMVRLNVEGFYYKISNAQLQNNLTNQAGTEIRNAGKSRLYGFEAELTVQPTSALTIMGSVSVVNGKYTSFPGGPTYFPQAPNAQIPIPQGCASNPLIFPAGGGGPVYPTSASAPLVAVAGGCDLSGNKTLQTIPFASNLSIIYSIPLGQGSVDLSGNWLHTDPYYFEPDNNPYTRQGQVDLINSAITWNSGSGLGVRLWVNNLTDKKYYSYIANSGTSGVKGSPAAPRTYGVTLTGRF